MVCPYVYISIRITGVGAAVGARVGAGVGWAVGAFKTRSRQGQHENVVVHMCAHMYTIYTYSQYALTQSAPVLQSERPTLDTYIHTYMVTSEPSKCTHVCLCTQTLYTRVHIHVQLTGVGAAVGARVGCDVGAGVGCGVGAFKENHGRVKILLHVCVSV